MQHRQTLPLLSVMGSGGQRTRRSPKDYGGEKLILAPLAQKDYEIVCQRMEL